MSALRLARAATGREKLLKFAGAYHGHLDGLLAEAGSGLATQALPASPGVPAAATANTVIVPWNDADAVARAAETTSSRRSSPSRTRRTWASSARRRASSSCCASARRRPARCSSSTRSSAASASPAAAPRSSTGVTPDLVAHRQGRRRRAAGRGLRRPARADGAHRARRRRLPGRDAQREPARRRRRAGDARHARRARLPAPAATTEALADGLREAAAATLCRSRSRRRPGLLTVFFSAEPVARLRRRAGAATSTPTAPGAAALLARGVYPPPSQFEAWFPSLAHGPEHVERTLEAAAAAFADRCRRERPDGRRCAARRRAPRPGRSAGRRAAARAAAAADGDPALGALAAAGPRPPAARRRRVRRRGDPRGPPPALRDRAPPARRRPRPRAARRRPALRARPRAPRRARRP